jgi:hypothetical protein
LDFHPREQGWISSIDVYDFFMLALALIFILEKDGFLP